MKKMFFLLFVFCINLFGATKIDVSDATDKVDSMTVAVGEFVVVVAALALTIAGILYMLGQSEQVNRWIKNIVIGAIISGLAGAIAALFG